MKIGVMNSPYIDLTEEIKWISKNKFNFIDLEPYNLHSINIRQVKETLDSNNLEVIGHTSPYLPYIFPRLSIRKACLEEFKVYIHIFKELGVKLMNIHPSYNAPRLSEEEKIKANIKFLKKVNKLCKSENITLMLENTFNKDFDNPKVFKRILNEVPGLMMNLDIGHTNIGEEKNLTEIFFEILGKKIIHIHLSDNKGRQDDHLPLGCGYIKWREIIKTIKKAEYDKTITLEIFAPDRDYLLMSRDKLKKWWTEKD